MEQDNVDRIAKNRQKFENVVWHVKNGVGLSLTADSELVQAIIWASERIGQLELENENLSKSILTLSKSPQLVSPDSGEEVYERQERERMLGEIRSCGHLARDLADKICWVISEFDAEKQYC